MINTNRFINDYKSHFLWSCYLSFNLSDFALCENPGVPLSLSLFPLLFRHFIDLSFTQVIIILKANTLWAAKLWSLSLVA